MHSGRTRVTKRTCHARSRTGPGKMSSRQLAARRDRRLVWPHSLDFGSRRSGVTEFTSAATPACRLARSRTRMRLQIVSALLSRRTAESPAAHTPSADCGPCSPGRTSSALDGRIRWLLSPLHQATAAAAFFARAARFGGCFPARLCSIAGRTITSINARCAST